MTDFTIRLHTQSDADNIRVLLAELQNHETTLHPNRMPWDAVHKTYWSWMIEAIEENEGFLYVAEREGKLLGLVSGWVDSIEAIAEDPNDWDYGYVQDIIVADDARRQGVAEALMQAAQNFFIEAEVLHMRLGVLANNHAARRFYEKLGMQTYEVTYELKLPQKQADEQVKAA
jgi:ribosomal protein S18 acetylase RimI-like enzyme